MKFDMIIPIGFFCGVAQELEKLNMRQNSYPFDWVISDLNTVNKLIRTNFNSLFEPSLLYRDSKYRYIVKHKEYTFNFYHDFDINLGIDVQIKKVKDKYNRRIKRFYSVLKSKKSILFVCYLGEHSTDNKPNQAVEHDINEFINIIEKYTTNFKILIIKHKNLVLRQICNDYILRIFDVEIDEDDCVNRSFVHTTPKVKEFFEKEIEYNVSIETNNDK